MIKKIRVVKQVGVFSDFDSGNDKEFDKLTFIYGLNTYGKSTLSDLFKSCTTNNPDFIIKRKTRPEDNIKPQQVVFSSLDDKTRKEKDICFQNNNWDSTDFRGKIELFDTAFVHENIFNGLSLLENRETKENFTDFILGDEGVKIATELEDKKRILRIFRKELRCFVPDFVKDKDEKVIQSFIDLKPEKDVNAYKREIEEKISKKTELKNNIQNKVSILKLSEPSKISLPDFDNLLRALYDINSILNTPFDDLKEEAIKKLQEHIKFNLKNDKNAENWIKQGLPFIDTDICPFCGQIGRAHV